MSNYRRNYLPGGTYFFTVVTYCRQRFLTTDLARTCLRKAIEIVRRDRPLIIVASVLLPDHLHMVWTLPRGDADYPTRWRRIKEEFTEQFLAAGVTSYGNRRQDASKDIAECGSADSGSTLSRMKMISSNASITSTTIPASTAW